MAAFPRLSRRTQAALRCERAARVAYWRAQAKAKARPARRGGKR